MMTTSDILRTVSLCMHVLFLTFYCSKSEELDFSIENARVLEILNNRSRAEQIEDEKISVNALEYNHTLEEIKELKEKLEKIELLNQFDEKVHQIIWSVKRGNDYIAKKHWEEIHDGLRNQTSSEIFIKEIIRKIALSTYEGIRTNLIPTINFIHHTQIYSGFFHLLSEMIDYGHIYYGSEIFYLANIIQTNCGAESELYSKLPIGVQLIDSHPVYLQNEKNEGVLIYKPSTKDCRGKFCVKNELFTYHEAVKPEEQEKVKFEFVKIPEAFSLAKHDPKFFIKIHQTVNSDNSTKMKTEKYLHFELQFKFKSPIPAPSMKSKFLVHLVNNTEDIIRIRYEQSHLVKRILMGKPFFGAAYTGIDAKGLEDRFDRANDGNWIVISARDELLTKKRRRRRRDKFNNLTREEPVQNQIFCQL